MFFQQQDHESLLRFLGEREVPKKYASEYAIRLKMFHSDGNSGPLGTLGLIDLLRFCGFKPVNAVEEVAETDWDKVKLNTRVEAKFGGWQSGTFLGFGQNRILIVRLDNDEFVKECRRDMVRLATEEPAAKQPKPTTEEIEPAPVEVGEVAPEMTAPLPSDWASALPGAKVWVEIGNDVPDGTFVSVQDDGQIVVLVNGQQHKVASNQVTLVA